MKNIQQLKQLLPDYLSKYHNINSPRSFFKCLNPNHNDSHPSMIFTDKYNICKCFSCGASYDIFDLIGLDYNLTNFNDKLNKLNEIYLNYSPSYYKPQPQKLVDYTEYYQKCCFNQKLLDYMSKKRGIMPALLKKYQIVYDQNTQMAIFPINKNCYFARSVSGNKKNKSRGNSDIWNKKILSNSSSSTHVYVTEGIIDSLSLETIDPSVRTISVNGVSNINQLIKNLKKVNFEGMIMIAFDNDAAGEQASLLLKEKLNENNIKSVITHLIPAISHCKDINELLVKDPKLLEKQYFYYEAVMSNYFNKMKEKENVSVATLNV